MTYKPGVINPPTTTASNDVQVGNGAGAWIKKTLAEFKTILGLGSAAYTASADYQPVDSDLTDIAGLSPSDNDIIQRKSGAWINRTLAQLLDDFPIAAGTYTSTLNNTTNVAASSAVANFLYLRILNMAIVAGSINIDPTTGTGTQTVLGMSVPVASNFGAVTDAVGVANNVTAQDYPGTIRANATNDRLEAVVNPQSNANAVWRFICMYRII